MNLKLLRWHEIYLMLRLFISNKSWIQNLIALTHKIILKKCIYCIKSKQYCIKTHWSIEYLKSQTLSIKKYLDFQQYFIKGNFLSTFKWQFMEKHAILFIFSVITLTAYHLNKPFQEFKVCNLFLDLILLMN